MRILPARYSATTAAKNFNVLIDHQCPQCGAAATLEETDHLFTCEFCRVKSYLLSRVYRYILPHKPGEGKNLLYLPYWRFKGMLFSCLADKIRHRVVDVSYQAVNSGHFPISVGLRSQAMRLRFLSPESEGRFLHPDLPYREMLGIIEKRFRKGLAGPVFLQDFIGERLSMLYSPFYVNDRIYDAVLNRPVSKPLPEDFDHRTLPGGRPKWRLQFVAAQCPECGWDLEGDRDSLALNCRNCQSVWHAGKRKFLKIKFAHVPASHTQVVFLPFWRTRAKVSGVSLNTQADLIKLANLPKVVQEPMRERPFYFWSPAFKVRPRDFLRLARRGTLAQPGGRRVAELPQGELYPVTLPVTEAVESLKVTLASFMKPERKLRPRLGEIELRPKSFALIYLPFDVRGSELSYAALRLRLNRNNLRYARRM